MSFRYVSVEEAIEADGLRMVVVDGVPSPFGEAAKGIFHLKQLDWLAVRLDYRNEALARWSGQQSGPVAIYQQEQPRDGWAAILLLAERLAPSPPLLPADAGQCDMQPAIRTAFEGLNEAMSAGLDPLLLAHRDRIYAQHLALPLSL